MMRNFPLPELSGGKMEAGPTHPVGSLEIRLIPSGPCVLSVEVFAHTNGV